jgi:hypothetical protein
MRVGFLAIAALLLGTSAVRAADPPLPPIVFQTQPLGRVLADIRSGADILGGDKGVKALNEGLKSLLGEKGFDGLDMGRPLVGYVVLAPKPADITAVMAFPVTGEKEFLELCDRVNKDKLKPDAKDKTLYHMPPLDPQYKALMRFQDRYAYIAYGANPEPHIAAKALVPMAKLFEPADRGIVAARIHFDRIPLAVKLATPVLMEEVKKTIFRGMNIDREKEAMDILNPAIAEIEKLAARYGKLVAGADVLAARLMLEVPSGNIVVEATVNGKPDSELAKTIAAFKPTASKFGGLLTAPDTVGGFKVRLPLFEEELRNAVAVGLEEGRKESLKRVQNHEKPPLDELFKGLARTVKTGEFDIAGAVRGPNNAGWFTAVGAVAFEDPSKLEKEFKTYIEKNAPQDVVDAIKWNAAKAGTVEIHTWKLTPGGFLDFTKVFGGNDCSVAFAFAPHGLFAAIGPDAVATLKDALGVKPAPSPVLDVVLNPARATKIMQKIIGPNDPDSVDVENVLGKEDKLQSIMSLTLEGGKELKATFTINLKVIPRAMLYNTIKRVGIVDKKNVPPGPIK